MQSVGEPLLWIHFCLASVPKYGYIFNNKNNSYRHWGIRDSHFCTPSLPSQPSFPKNRPSPPCILYLLLLAFKAGPEGMHLYRSWLWRKSQLKQLLLLLWPLVSVMTSDTLLFIMLHYHITEMVHLKYNPGGGLF